LQILPGAAVIAFTGLNEKQKKYLQILNFLEMKKFENLGKVLTKKEQKRIGGGQVCFARCPNGQQWGLDCNGSCSSGGRENQGVIFCNGQPYYYGCQ
jgi:hypothetical protein